MTAFTKAEKRQAKLRLAIDGPSGSGKTFTALVAATTLAGGAPIAVIDTERNSASLYADIFAFDVATLNNYHPKGYIDLIEQAEQAGYAVIVIDSLSHAWEGEGGVLELHDQAVKKQRTENSFTAWKDVTPIHRKLVDAMLQSKCHIIATMRSKTEYVIQSIEVNGRTIQQPKKVGMAPIQRQGMEYEFTIVGDMDVDHNLIITKSRCAAVADAVVSKPGADFFQTIAQWLTSGAPALEQPTTAPEQPQNGSGNHPAPETTELEKALKIEVKRQGGGLMKLEAMDMPTLRKLISVAPDPTIKAAAQLVLDFRQEQADEAARNETTIGAEE